MRRCAHLYRAAAVLLCRIVPNGYPQRFSTVWRTYTRVILWRRYRACWALKMRVQQGNSC